MRLALALPALLLSGCAATPPPPASAIARGASAWSQDAAALLEELREKHPDPARWVVWEVLEKLADDVGAAGIDEAERAARMARLVATVGDGHTVMPLLDLPVDGVAASPTKSLLPLRFEQFDDGLYVVGAGKPYAALLGKKVEAIGGEPIETLMTRVRRLLPTATPRFAEEYAPEWLMSDVVLTHVGALAADGTVRVRAGATEASVALRPKARFDWLKTRTAGPYADWVAETDPAPLNEGEEGVTMPASGILYWKIVELRAPSRSAWKEQLEAIRGQFDAMNGRRLVLDLRDNIGGDGSLVDALIAALDTPALHKPEAFVVLIGRRCHSACVMLVSALEKRGQVTFVGQAAGDAPNHLGETNIFVLPRTGYPVVHASENYVTSFAGDPRPYKVPDVPFSSTHADFAAGRDPAMAWALTERPAR